MKKLLFLGLTVLAAFTLSGCTEADNQEVILAADLGSEESLATLSYLSTGFLDFSTEPVLSSNMAFLSNTDGEAEPTTVIEGELDEVNVYIDRLKALIENGVEDFGSVLEEPSDNELYAFKLTFTVNEEVYVIYYNIDELTSEMTGIIVIGEVEYEFEVMDNIKEYEHNQEEKPEKEDNENGNVNSNGSKEDDDEVDTEDEEETEEPDDLEEDTEESETKMILIATNGEDTIKIIYKTELEDGEFETKFYVHQTIEGVEKHVTLKIEVEDDETKVKITDGEDSYTFKKEVEDEETVYILQYEVDGVKGMVRITEVVDDEGNITYDYFIQEAGREKHTEKQEPKSHFDDDEEDLEDEEENEV